MILIKEEILHFLRMIKLVGNGVQVLYTISLYMGSDLESKYITCMITDVTNGLRWTEMLKSGQQPFMGFKILAVITATVSKEPIPF
jgi:hypothetical protein